LRDIEKPYLEGNITGKEKGLALKTADAGR
jgi:hypothetical protein